MSWIRSAILIPVLLVVCSLQAHAETRKLQAGDVTISYPSGMEQQAKDLAKVAQAVAPDRIVRAKHIRDAFADPKSITKTITDLIGCPESAGSGIKVVSAFSKVLDVYSCMFTDFRVYKESDLKASSGLSEGPVRLVYDPKTGEFTTNLSFGMSTSGEAFTPFVVRDDGSFATKNLALHTYVSQRLDDDLWGMLAPIHETTESILVRDLGIGHPFSRWFNEGVGNWVMLALAAEIEPSIEKQFRPMSLPRLEDSAIKPKINLPAWPNAFLAKENPTPDEQNLSDASYRFATEAVDRMLRGLPPDTLAKIISELKAGPDPDSDAICRAVGDVTGRDAKGILAEYTPEYVRAGIKSGEPKSLLDQAKSAMDMGDDAEALKPLDRLAGMTPTDASVHMNLACALRRTGAPKPESERHIKTAASLLSIAGGNPQMVVFGKTADSGYVLGRTIQLVGYADQAKGIFDRVLEMDPKHVDTLAALKELDNKQ